MKTSSILVVIFGVCVMGLPAEKDIDAGRLVEARQEVEEGGDAAGGEGDIDLVHASANANSQVGSISIMSEGNIADSEVR